MRLDEDVLTKLPAEFVVPGIWIPVRQRKAYIKLPFNARNRSANPEWIKDALGIRAKVVSGPDGSWVVVRTHADALLEAMSGHFGPGRVTVVFDTSTQRACGPACQNARSDTALRCDCQCGGENHGGLGSWRLHGEFAIATTYHRRVWKV